VSDLPVLVGIARRHYLNASPGLAYFQTHVPAIPARGQLRWVLTIGRRLATRAVPFARVGTATVAFQIKTLPELRVATSRASRGDALVTLENPSSVPQYELPIYAVAQRDGREVAAGVATIPDLASGAQIRLRVPLIGNPSGATLSLEAPPTIFN
jgi:hypothetical protein